MNMGLYVCELEFKTPDKNEPFHSLTEIDYYAWIPARFHETERNHRLKLWFNYKNEKFELVKDYMDMKSGIGKWGNADVFITTNVDIKQRETVFSSENLEAVLVEANELWNHYHSEWAEKKREVDKVCEHDFPNMSSFCMKRHH